MKTILFDLEETLIRSWDDPELLHRENPQLLPWIRQQGTFRAGLLSMAVWDFKDLVAFNTRPHMRLFIEEQFGFEFDDQLIFLEHHILNMARKQLLMPFLERDDLGSFLRKKEFAELIWNHRFKIPNHELILLDDTVDNLTIVDRDIENCQLTLANPKRFS